MRAALYARYSTEKQRAASITDQFRNCERLCASRGWTIVARIKDEAVSGASAITQRPGYAQLLEDAQAGKFDVIVCDEISRLWRDQEEQWRAVNILEYHEVHLMGVSDGINSQASGYRVILSVRGGMNEEARREIAWRTHRGLTGQAMQGYSAGGRSYGYRLVPIQDGAERVGVMREVHLDEAEVVRRIYRRFAEGASCRRIAHELNHDRIPSPRGSTWSLFAIYGDRRSGVGILNNPLYAGQVIWNRSRWVRDPRTKKRKRKERDRSEWIVHDAPDLRIVDSDLWDRVQVRLAMRQEKGRGRRPTYLLSGLIRCGECGGAYVTTYRNQYGCGTHRDRGPDVCKNGLRVDRQMLGREVLAGIKREVLSPESVEIFRRELARELRESRTESNAKPLKERHTQIEAEIANMIAAIRAGSYSSALRTALTSAEAELAAVAEELALLEQSRRLPEILPGAVDEYREMVERLEALTQEEHDDETREAVSEMLGGSITLLPLPDQQAVEIRIEGAYAGLLRIAAGGRHMSSKLVAGVGFEPTTFGL